MLLLTYWLFLLFFVIFVYFCLFLLIFCYFFVNFYFFILKRFRLLCEIGAWGSAKETPLEVKLDRNHMVFESVAFVMRLTPGQLRTRFKIVYNGETGIDSGGLTKDWYLELSRSLM